MLDEHHVVCGGVPHLIQDKTKGNLVLFGLTQQRLVVFVFAHRRAALGLAVLFVDVGFGLGDQTKSHRQPRVGALLHHSDRGGQYASLTYQHLLADHHITVSMSRTADPYDNALMESCIGTLKTECADHQFPSRQVARTQLFAYLEGWYNRLHSTLGYVSPDQFEQRFLQDKLLLHSKG